MSVSGNKKEELLYFYPLLSSFIRKDLEILSGEFTVKSYGFRTDKKAFIPVSLIRQKLVLLKNIFSASIVVCRFAGYHSLLPLLFARLFNNPSLLIIGGTEAHYFPAINYGNKTKKMYGWATKVSLKLAKHIAPVDESLLEHRYTYDDRFPEAQGIRKLYKGINTPVTVIHNGYDDKLFYPEPTVSRKPGSFLTVANAGKEFEFYLKGIDLLLEASKLFPDNTFTIAGIPSAWIDQSEYPNVRFEGPVANDQLRDLYSSHEFYLQLSVAEGFPNTLCEAMLCGCIPIGSDVFSIPQIIGYSGFVVRWREIGELKRVLTKALSQDNSGLSVSARKRISENFTIERRALELLRLIQELVTAGT